MQSEEVRNRVKNTTLERYGVEYLLQNKELKEKSKKHALKNMESNTQRNQKSLNKKCVKLH